MNRWRCAGMAFILARTLSVSAGPEEGPSLQGTTFLLEDAYNQEAGVLQHLVKGFSNRKRGGSLWIYSQEWPLFNASHQLELGISALRPGEGDQGRGFGDAYLGYQYQLFGGEDEALTGALALTLTLPTGNHRWDRGNGAVGYEVEFPLSVRLSEAWGAHANLEVSFVPGARNEEDERADLRGWALGQSFVWHMGGGFHLMLGDPRIRGGSGRAGPPGAGEGHLGEPRAAVVPHDSGRHPDRAGDRFPRGRGKHTRRVGRPRFPLRGTPLPVKVVMEGGFR